MNGGVMNSLRRTAFVIALVISGSLAHAAQPISSREVLTWIGSHFETLDYTSETGGGDTEHFVSRVQLTFQGCTASLNYFATSTVISPPSREPPVSSNITYGPFELSNLRPESISVVGDPNSFGLVIKAINPFPSNNGTQTFSESAVHISFATKEMANRQAKAWRDAIIGCGGKAVSDNLY